MNQYNTIADGLTDLFVPSHIFMQSPACDSIAVQVYLLVILHFPKHKGEGDLLPSLFSCVLDGHPNSSGARRGKPTMNCTSKVNLPAKCCVINLPWFPLAGTTSCRGPAWYLAADRRSVVPATL